MDGHHHLSNITKKLGEKKKHCCAPKYMQDNNHVGSRMCTLQQHYILVSRRSILSLVIQTAGIRLDVSL